MRTIVSSPGSGAGTSTGTYASRPAAGSVGRVYYASNSVYPFLDDGTLWRPIIRGKLGYEPSLTGFTEYRQNGLAAATLAVTAGQLAFTFTSNGGAEDLRCAAKSFVGALRVEMFFRFATLPQSGAGAAIMGIGFRDSTTGRVEVCEIEVPQLGSGAAAEIKRHRATASNTTATPVYTFSASLTSILANTQNSGVLGANGIWMAAISDGAGGKSYEFSLDGVNWVPIANLTTAANDFLAADQYIISAWTSTITLSAQVQGAYFYSIKENP